MRLPNGYGSVSKLKGSRRRPYIVRLTTGWEDSGKPIVSVLGYYRTRTEGLQALADYHQHPINLEARKLTFAEIYAMWTKEKYGLGKKIPNIYTAAYARCAEITQLPFVDLRTTDFQRVIDKCNNGYSSKKNIKTMINQMTKLALANDISNKNYAAFCKLPPETGSSIHKPFTAKEITALWALAPKDVKIQTILILIYTGLRPTEFLQITKDNVHLEDRYMLGGIKTAAGKNRIIPIADKIMPFIAALYEKADLNGNKYLLEDSPNESLTYGKYRTRYFVPAINSLPPSMRNHLPHDGRHTCATLMDNAEINETIKKKILGHSGKDVTEKVYTHKTIEQLVAAINKI